jgi:hypothetical protein
MTSRPPVKGRRMTLIAKFDCPSENGIVMLADSQETRGEYRVDVKKIVPEICGNYEVAMGGSGYIGPLIDGQDLALRDALRSIASGKSERDLRRVIRNSILAYHRGEVAAHPESDDSKKLMEFLICARDIHAHQIFSWRTYGTVVKPGAIYELLGWDHDVYHEFVRPHFAAGAPDLPFQQAIVLGLRLFMAAERTLNCVSEPTTLVVITPDKIHLEEAAEVSAMRKRIAEYDKLLRDLVISCPDTSIEEHIMRDKIAQFGEAAMRLHSAFIDAAATRAFWAGKFFATDYPYPRWPPGMEFWVSLSEGKVRAKALSKEQRKNLRQLVHVGTGLPRPSTSQTSEPEKPK